jgi:Xaa-Pro aminopeptidase
MTAYAHSQVDRPSLRRYRLERIRRELRRRDYGGVVLFDPANLRYATDIPNMQVWALHNKCRYVYVPTEGPVTLFDYGCALHLSAGDDLIAETRTAVPHTYFTNGGRHPEFIGRWAAEIADLVRRHGGGNRRLAVDKLDPPGTHALERLGVTIADGDELMEWARVIKNADELVAIKESIAACEAGIAAMWRELKPGMTENELWSHLHATNIAKGGEWIECRLLASGERTNPWFQECSDRVIQPGDIVAFDTDLVGPNGYCADISRTWIAGDVRPTDEQRRLYGVALDNLHHNLALVKAGLSLREFTEKSFPLPEEFVARRYSCIMHGVGMVDEFPFGVYPQDWQTWGFDGVLEAGMTICVEALIGAVGGKECVKLEQQVLVTEGGYELLSHAPLGLRPEY